MIVGNFWKNTFLNSLAHPSLPGDKLQVTDLDFVRWFINCLQYWRKKNNYRLSPAQSECCTNTGLVEPCSPYLLELLHFLWGEMHSMRIQKLNCKGPSWQRTPQQETEAWWQLPPGKLRRCESRLSSRTERLVQCRGLMYMSMRVMGLPGAGARRLLNPSRQCVKRTAFPRGPHIGLC